MRQNRFQPSNKMGRLNTLLQPVRELGACALNAALMAVPDMTPSAAARPRRQVGGQSPSQVTSPVVLVHGYGGAKTQWLLVERALSASSYRQITTMEYDACSTDIPGLARQLCGLVHAVLAETGATQVHLVGHSLGGVIIRYAVTMLGLDDVVAAAVTVASPHGGSPIARLGTSTTAAQLRPGSSLLRQLEAAVRPGRARWTAFSAGCDVVVPAARARVRPAELAAQNVTIPGEGHLSILLSPRLVRAVVQAIVSAERVAEAPASGNGDPALAAAA
jgi:triacylglycerol esterase/lipase EstA (alpha/beta hydrolase family)